MRKIILTALMVLIATSFGMNRLYAESDVGVGVGVNAEASLDFSIAIPTILYLRIGSAGATIDTVAFNVTDAPENQPTVAGNSSVAVRVGAIVPAAQAIQLDADSSTALTDGGTNSIPFSVIAYAGDSDFASASASFDGTAAQTVWSDSGGGLRSGNFNYTYTNSYDHPPGDYTGEVTYTLSAP